MLSLVHLLSDREKEVFELLASLETNAEIAEELVVSTNTVKYHLKNIYSKLGVEDRAEAIALAREVVQQQASATRLPQPIDRFVGRESDIDTIVKLLLKENKRLITVTGLGGVGKTRLCIEIAHRIQQRYTDGAYFVNLIQRRTTEAFLMSLHHALGLAHSPEQASITQDILYFLREKSALLVFDNFEDVLDASAFVVELLAYCPNVNVLVTSRERLLVHAETVYQLEGISLDNNQAMRSEAYKLFIEAATRVQPELILDDTDEQAIQEICELTNGLPLAIILAASWVSMLPIAEIPGELKADLGLLEIDYHDLPLRHRSLLELFHRQLGHLDPKLYDITVHLTVFVSGFSRQAASAISNASLQTLRRLIDLSFLTHDSANDVYHFHPLLRQFIESYGLTVTDLSHIRQKHSEYFLNLLSQEILKVEGSSLLTNSLENILAGWQWAFTNNHDALVNRYLSGLFVYGQIHGWSRFGHTERQIFESILRDALDTSKDNQAGYAYLCLASMHRHYGENAQAMACLKAGIELDKGTSLNEMLLSNLLYLKSSLLIGRRQFEAALEALDDAERELGEPDRVLSWRLWIDIQLNRCNSYYWQNNLPKLSDCIESLAPKMQQFGTLVQQADLWHRKSNLEFRQSGSITTVNALGYSRESLKLCHQIGSTYWIMQRKFSLGFLYLWAGHPDLAESYLLQARLEGEYLGLRDYLRYPYVYLSILYRFLNDLEQVKYYTDLVQDDASRLMDKVYLGIVFANHAWLASRAHQWASCVEQGQHALEHWKDVAYPMQWLACFPLIEAHYHLQQAKDIPEYIQHVLQPDQQALPSDLIRKLEMVLDAIEHNDLDMMDNLSDLIRQLRDFRPATLPIQMNPHDD